MKKLFYIFALCMLTHSAMADGTTMTDEKACQILGIDPRSATEETITKAYHKLALKMSPDKGGSHEEMTELNNAKEFLMQSSSRDEDAYPFDPSKIGTKLTQSDEASNLFRNPSRIALTGFARKERFTQQDLATLALLRKIHSETYTESIASSLMQDKARLETEIKDVRMTLVKAEKKKELDKINEVLEKVKTGKGKREEFRKELDKVWEKATMRAAPEDAAVATREAERQYRTMMEGQKKRSSFLSRTLGKPLNATGSFFEKNGWGVARALYTGVDAYLDEMSESEELESVKRGAIPIGTGVESATAIARNGYDAMVTLTPLINNKLNSQHQSNFSPVSKGISVLSFASQLGSLLGRHLMRRKTRISPRDISNIQIYAHYNKKHTPEVEKAFSFVRSLNNANFWTRIAQGAVLEGGRAIGSSYGNQHAGLQAFGMMAIGRNILTLWRTYMKGKAYDLIKKTATEFIENNPDKVDAYNKIILERVKKEQEEEFDEEEFFRMIEQETR